MKIRKHLARVKKRINFSFLGLIDLLYNSDLLIRRKMKNWGYDANDYKFQKNQTSFVHVPKTGGSSLAVLLERDLNARFLNLRLHRPISIHCPPVNFRYITILRDPVDRVWSLYKMTLNVDEGHHYRKFAKRGLEVFLQKYWASRNMYCRYFSGQVFIEPSRSTLEQSLENLALFEDILMFDHLTEQIFIIANKYNLPNKQVPHLRKSNNESPSAEQRALISRYNQLDIDLYERVRHGKRFPNIGLNH